MCDQYCSNNIVTTVTDLVQAIWDDIETIVALIGRCFGGVRAANIEPMTRQRYRKALPFEGGSSSILCD